MLFLIAKQCFSQNVITDVLEIKTEFEKALLRTSSCNYLPVSEL